MQNSSQKLKIKKLTALAGQANRWSLTAFSAASREGGHTLIELMVVVTIIAILSSITLYNYYSRRGQDALLLETQKVAQMIRRAQNLALSPQLGGTDLYSFGVYFNKSQNQNIILFTDKDRDNLYDTGEKIEELQLYKDVQISDLKVGLTNSDYLNIVYIPPDPSVIISGSISGIGSTAEITVGLKNNSTGTKTINVGLTGLVEVNQLATQLPPPSYICSNGLDDDGDGKTDYPNDPGCTGSTDDNENYACSDGQDNDTDGKIDHPNDPGCSDSTDNDETDVIAPPPPPLSVQWSVASGSINENGITTYVAAQLSGLSTIDVTVPFTVTGTAIGNGTDYLIAASPITIPANSTVANVAITIVGDTIIEGMETIILTMGTPTNAILGTTTVLTVTIIDDDGMGPPPR